MQVDPYFLERIDILKGPSSVLYGRSSPGGLVALTTKKPLFTPTIKSRPPSVPKASAAWVSISAAPWMTTSVSLIA